MQRERETTYWIDLLRAFATYLVVLLHSSAPVLTEYNKLGHSTWWAGNFYDSLTRACVPLFFLISGTLLLDRQEPLVHFFKKRFTKVVIPLIAWSLFYLFFNIYFLEKYEFSLGKLISILYEPVYYHLWFFYTLIGLYFCVPILRIIVDKDKQTLTCYFISLWLLFFVIVRFLERLIAINVQLEATIASGFIGYLLIGHLLRTKEIGKSTFLLSSLLFLFSSAITMVGTYWITVTSDGKFNNLFYAYLSPNVVASAVALFIVFKYLGINSNLLNHRFPRKAVSVVCSASVGIYCVHPLLLVCIHRSQIGKLFNYSLTNSWFSLPALSIVVFFLSLLLISIIRKIPVLKLLSP